MSERKEGLIALPAAEDLSAKAGYLAVIVNDSGTPKAALPSDNGDLPVYVIRNGAEAGSLADLEPLHSNVQIQVKAKGTGNAGDLLILADTTTAADKGKVRAITGNDPWLLLGVAEETFVDGQMVKMRPILTIGTLTKLVAASLYTANSILAATTANTPAAVAVAEERLLGRLTGSGIAALTGAEAAGVLDQTHRVIAAGVHAWAGGAAATDSIAVADLEADDVVVATLAVRASTETLVLAVNDADNGEIDLTLSDNGTDATTKVAYVVLRAYESEE